MRDRAMVEGGEGEQGFALIEILVAIAIISIGLLGLASAMAVQSGGLSSAVAAGQGAVTRGYYVSTAILLAQDRLEQVKKLKYTLSPAVDELGSSTTLPPTGFDDETPVSGGYANFSRQVRVQTYPAANMKTATVTVSFNLPTPTGVNTESVVLSTVIAARP